MNYERSEYYRINNVKSDCYVRYYIIELRALKLSSASNTTVNPNKVDKKLKYIV